MTRSRFFKFFIVPIVLVTLMAGCRQQGEEPNPSAGNGGNASSSATGNQPPNSQSPTSPDPSSSQPSTTPPKTDSGSDSTVKPPAAVRMDKITAVRLADPQSGWIGGKGWIARTDDGGKTWNAQYSGEGTVEQLFALNDREAWAVVGDAGNKSKPRQLLGTKDGGKTWTAVGTMPNTGFLHFVSSDEAYSGNAKTTDGGKTWAALPVPEQTVGDAYFHDRHNGWAVTQDKDMLHVKRTTDGGESWQNVMSRKTVAQLTGALIRSAGANDAWVEWIGESGMTQTSYSLFHTSDGGKAWQTVIANSTAGGGPAPGFPIDHSDGPKNTGSKPGALYVVDPNVAFMGGQCMACDKPNTIGWTIDGGKTWVNGEAAFAGYGQQLLAIADATHGWWIVTDTTEPAVMYTTSDGGKSWQKAHTFEKLLPGT
ncbi:hypothetical protein FE783_34770 [Paenibacillus mesophilus]|uniref:hypothetical protein n=1 Tax=Paenibacillus mesophilus TaxID=2582849 RepID=UPI00110F070F|nr:hypothetical protein [Paenibacillus mesophilus]TMV43687.1 hypothetical protein FE783_34770 [Paenibacillus mesophilus]